MSRNTISQREARSLKKRVEELEAAEDRRRNAWTRDYPGGVNIATSTFTSSAEFLPAVVKNSRLLGHAVVVTSDGGTLRYFALPLAGLRK
jgi:hypothetical protein